MSSFIITGGQSLKGTITPQGAKNEALQILCATLLTGEEIVVDNVPDILDVNNLIALLGDMGAQVSRLGDRKWSFKADQINLDYFESDDFARRNSALRGSIMLVGPMLARFGKAIVAKPGGDKIGRRHIDTHMEGLVRLGAEFFYDTEKSKYVLKASTLSGCEMLLSEASVTGTANIVMAAALAKGRTVVYNAACEPYVQQLCKMLCAMGARISGIGSNLLTIDGVESLHGCAHTILPDMIELLLSGQGIRSCQSICACLLSLPQSVES